MFGSHLSISDGLAHAAREADSLGFETVQIFTKNQRQWKVKPLEETVADEWTAAIDELGWNGRTVSHASYLINLASPDDELWNKSIDLMTEEIERCERLRIPFLVHHPGAYTTADAESGLGRIAEAYKELFRRTRGYENVACLEDTVGSGSNLGRTFDELARLRALILEATGLPDRVGFCFDTCHAHAGGYDMASRGGAEAVLAEFDRLCGLEHLRVIHLNDSIGEAGSRKDRHAHIGEGTIGTGTTAAALAQSGFAAVVNHPALKTVPKILETPKESTSADTPMDVINLRRLRRLMGAAAGRRGPERA
ncbi:MAG: deoxyribonuclease IV [Phycisphaerales bacterium]|nr:deoxyribonuclease IV [Phycisphaerales bacterium]